MKFLYLSTLYLTSAAAVMAAAVFERHEFALPERSDSVVVLDIDDDGDRDLVALCRTAVYAVRLPEGELVTLRNMRDGGMIYATDWDADGDGDMDVAVGRFQSPWVDYRQALEDGKDWDPPKGPDFTVGWLENPEGAGELPWALHVVDTQFNGTHGVGTGDITGDGQAELLANSVKGPHFERSMAWYAAGAPADSGRNLIAEGNAGGRPHYFDTADMDGDGDIDVLHTDNGSFSWWENPSVGKDEWRQHGIARERGATNIRAADFNNDGQPDVVGACGHGKGLRVYLAPDWQAVEVDMVHSDWHAMDVGDLDGDGDLDIAAGSFSEGIVYWFEQTAPLVFTAHAIDVDNGQQSYDLKVRDVDGDGSMDIVVAGRRSNNLVWYKQQEGADGSLVERLQNEYGLKPRLNEAGELHALYGVKGEMNISEADWQALAQTPSLRHIQAVRLKMEEVVSIGKMQQLTHLNLSGGDLDFDAAMAHIAKLENLENLNIHHTHNFKGEGLVHLPKISGLKHLTLHNLRPFDAEGIIGHVAQLKELEELHLTALIYTLIEDLEPLRGHAHLKSLIYPNGDVLVPFLNLLNSMPEIEEFMILSKPGELRKLNNEVIKGILDLEKLKKIEMHNVTMARAQYERLAQAFPEAKITMSQREHWHAEQFPVEPY